jgi:hypothetical protein
MRFLLLLFCVFLAVGCKLSKEESTLARVHDEIKNKKKELPKGFLTETQVGVKYYPDADAMDSTQLDEGGRHTIRITLSTPDSEDKVRDFYEKEIGAKAMPVQPGMNTIQSDKGGRHYQVGYSRFDQPDTTVVIEVSWPTG